MTVEPSASCPPAGSWVTTLPDDPLVIVTGDLVHDEAAVLEARRGRRRRRALITLGTDANGAPVDTLSVAVSPRVPLDPTPGLTLITMPAGTVRLLASLHDDLVPGVLEPAASASASS